MERVITVSLSEWVTWLQSPDHAALAAFLALSAFLAIYITSRNQMARDERIRLDYVNSTLERYAAAAGSLMSATESASSTPADPSALRDKLLASRAAPYVSENVLAQIAAYIEDDDASRLPLLLRTIERESETLIAERDKLLRHMEGPGWGSWLWRMFRPVLPGVLAAAFFISLLWLWRLLDTSLSGAEESGNAWELALGWMQLTSSWFALLTLSLAVLGGRNRHVNAVPARLLGAVIAVLAVGHWAASWLAPYLLGAQLLLFLGGFRLNSRKPRRARPYVGHDPLPMTPQASDGVSSEAVQSLSPKGGESETTQ